MVYAIADGVMSQLGENDSVLYNHLEKISRLNVVMNAKDFVIELMYKVSYLVLTIGFVCNML